MQWKFLLALAFVGLPMGTLAQVCCPAGCVQDNNRCVTTGPTPRSCGTVACASRPGGTSTGTPGIGAPVIVYPRPPQRPHTPTCCEATHRPGGSYSRTCRDYEMHCDGRNEMLATCKDRRGRDVRTALPTVSTCLQVENENGQMKCRKRTPRPPAECV